jgi:hypothetical protein
MGLTSRIIKKKEIRGKKKQKRGARAHHTPLLVGNRKFHPLTSRLNRDKGENKEGILICMLFIARESD